MMNNNGATPTVEVHATSLGSIAPLDIIIRQA
jgi:hypothetical protein